MSNPTTRAPSSVNARVLITALSAVELDHLHPAVGQAVAEGNPAVAVEDDFLAPEMHLGIGTEDDEGAVAALVDEHEFPRAQLDLGVAARGHGIHDEDRVAVIAPQKDGVPGDDLAAAVDHLHLRPARGLRRNGGRRHTAWNDSAVHAGLPHQLVD